MGVAGGRQVQNSLRPIVSLIAAGNWREAEIRAFTAEIAEEGPQRKTRNSTSLILYGSFLPQRRKGPHGSEQLRRAFFVGRGPASIQMCLFLGCYLATNRKKEVSTGPDALAQSTNTALCRPARSAVVQLIGPAIDPVERVSI